MEEHVAFEELPDGALALRFLAAIQDQYGEDARMPVDDGVRACIWLLLELLAEELPAERERILEVMSSEVLTRHADLNAPLN
jgi:hypothetical protein